jgi:diaminohydroxyphosphoribosylaminopyrimidine deaminase/5-amino-6-(5-phosphoribosylamino)uracil reductase
MVNGKGVERLQEAGIDVHVGIMEKECIRLNEAYFKYITQKKPFVTLKIAQTLDGKIATDRGLSRWITGETSRRRVHRMRSENDTVLVGVNTIITDDPELSVRSVRGRNPLRIILDSRLRIPHSSRVIIDSKSRSTVLATTSGAPSDKIKRLRDKGVAVWILKSSRDGTVDLSALWKKMAEEGITSVLVEGGKEVFTSILRAGEADRVVVFIAPKIFGRGIDAFGELNVPSPDKAVEFKEIAWHRRGSDIIFEGRC